MRFGLSIGLVAVAGCTQIIGIQDLDSDERPISGSGRPPRVDAAADVVVDASLEVIIAPDAPDARPELKRVFVTSDRMNGKIGGVAVADTLCTTIAQRAGSKAPWVAWLSGDGKNAIDRIEWDGPYKLVDGRQIVANKAQLASGKLSNPIELTEKGTKVSAGDESELRVWTGTTVDGKTGATCADGSASWASSYAGNVGTIGSIHLFFDERWTDTPGPGIRNWTCLTAARLYCFEK